MPLQVKDLMVSDVLCVQRTATVSEVAQLFRRHGVNGAPVVDETGQPVGVVSRTDLMAGWEHAEVERRRVYYCSATGELSDTADVGPVEAFGRRPVDSVMMSLVFSVQKNDPVRKAAELMTAEGIHRVVVLDGTKLAGILSASDLVRAVAKGQLLPAG